MSRSAPDSTIPAALRALGGWASADWFCPSVLNDQEVVGFTLPKLADVGSQSFRLVERSTPPPAAGSRLRAASARPPTQLAARLAMLLESSGASRIAAFRRPTLLFSSPAILFFAEFPAARLKPRGANKLRRDLVDIDLTACVLHAGRQLVTIMIWPAAEDGIGAFIDCAMPPYPLHKEFRRAPGLKVTRDRRGSGTPDTQADAATVRRLEKERKQLIAQIEQLRAQVDDMARSQPTVQAIKQLGLDDAKLKSMLILLHPDKHGNSEAANEAAKWVNGLRDMLKGRDVP